MTYALYCPRTPHTHAHTRAESDREFTSLGHWLLQEPSSTFDCSSADVSFLQGGGGGHTQNPSVLLFKHVQELRRVSTRGYILLSAGFHQ